MTTANEVGQKTWKRRGLFAAAAAVAAGVFAKVTTRSVEAADGGNAVLGVVNTEMTPTTFTNTTGSSESLHVYCQGGTVGWGVYALGSGYGVVSYGIGAPSTNLGGGVFGGCQYDNGTGVTGYANGVGNGNVGVRGQSINGNGVVGTSNGNGSGVVGTITGAMNGIGVYGFNASTYTGASPGSGGFGFYGGSARGHGVFGNAQTAGAGAVVGYNTGVAGCYAGLFYGDVVVQGNFTVQGGAKSAAVPHPDGTHRRLYCVETPESWFEDVGEGCLECGEADITLDPDFAAIVHADNYHVFLTPYGGAETLGVAERTARGFRVVAGNAASDATFSWRVMARRKDIKGERLETVEIPRVPEVPVMPEITTPERPQPRARQH